MKGRKGSSVKPLTVISTIVICAAVCLAGVGYLWGKTEVWRLSRDFKKLELRRDELKRNNDVLQREYAAMCTRDRLTARVRELNLGLAMPQPNQIVRIREPWPVSPAVGAQNPSRVYASKTND